MPELPEVETVRRGLEQNTLRMEIVDGQVLYPRTIAHPSLPQDFLGGLRHTAFCAWQRRGKYLLGQLRKTASSLEGGRSSWLGVHLRMTGQLLWLDSDAALQKHTRVRLLFAGGQELRFVDQRTFGQMWWVAPDQTLEEVMTGLQRLGPEPFTDEFSVEYLWNTVRGRQRPIKTALLDQSLVAGLGNIYTDESLFLSGIQPMARCCDLSPEVVERLHGAILQVLSASLEAGGTSFSNFLAVTGVNGRYGGMAWVYGRQGQDCRHCGTTLERIKLGGRSTCFCPRCQQ